MNETKPLPAADEVHLNLPRWKSNFWLGVITFLYVFDLADRQVITIVLPFIKAEYMLTDAQVGLIGSILMLTLGALVIPSAWLVDKWSRKYMISIMVTIWSLATWATGRAASVTQLLLVRMGVGVGEAGYNPAGYALISAWFPKNLRARMIGIFNGGQLLGQVLGMGLGGLIVFHWGWRSVFGIFAIPGFILAVLILFAPDYKTRKADMSTRAVQEAKPGFVETLRYIVKSPTLLALYLCQIPYGLWAWGVSVWAVPFFMRTFHLNVKQVGGVLAITQLLLVVAPFLGGWLADWWLKRSPSGRVWAGVFCVVWAAVFWSGAFFGAAAGMPLIAVAALWVIGQAGNAAHGSGLLAGISELVPPHYRGVAQGFMPLCMAILGFASGGIVGALSDRFGLIWALEITLLVGYGLELVFLFIAARTYPRDHERLVKLGSFVLESK